jgi:hypothetical protein
MHLAKVDRSPVTESQEAEKQCRNKTESKAKMAAHAEALTNLEVQNSALKATIAELQL